MGSPAGKLNGLDLRKIATGAALAALGGVAAWFGSELAPELTENGSTLAIVIATVTPILLNALRKWLTDTRAGIHQHPQGNSHMIRSLLLAALSATLFCGSASAQTKFLKLENATPGVHYLEVTIDEEGNVQIAPLTIAATVTLGPPPVEPSNERVETMRALAPAGQSKTAAKIAALSVGIAGKVRSGDFSGQQLISFAVRIGIDRILGDEDAKAWRPVRDKLGDYWTDLVTTEGVTDLDYAELLEDFAEALSSAQNVDELREAFSLGAESGQYAEVRVNGYGIDLSQIIEIILWILELIEKLREAAHATAAALHAMSWSLAA